MRRSGLLALGVALVLPSLLVAQVPATGLLTGRVVSATTEAPVTDAVIIVEGAGRRSRTGSKGTFRIDSLPPGVYTVRAIAIGFAPAVRSDVAVGTGKPAEVVFQLREKAFELGDLEVIAEAYFEPAGESPPSTQSLSAEEVRRAPGVQEDILRAVALFPGVGITTGGRNDLAVRGGAPFENLFVVDHLEVPNLNHFGSQGSTGGPLALVNLDFVEQATFTAGGAGARYGDRVGAATEIALREGNRERVAGEVNLSATGFGAIAEGPVGNGSFLLSARRSYLDLLFNLAGFNFVPSYWDAQFKLTQQIGARDQLSWTTVGAIDRVDFNNETAGDRVDNSRIMKLDQDQYFSGLTWRRSFGHGRLSTTLGRTWSRFRSEQYDSLQPPQPVFRNHSTEGENSLRVEYVGEAGARRNWSAGVTGHFASKLRYEILLPGPLRLDQNGAPAPLVVDTSFTAWRAGGFADWTERWGKGLRTTLGARVDHYDYLSGAWRLSPRASLGLDLGGPVLRLAAGRYWQPPAYVWLVGDATNPAALKPFFADHLVVGVEQRPRADLKLQFEAYYKRYGDYPARVFRPQAVLAPSGFEDVKSDIPYGLEPLQSEGKGRSWGLEAFAQKRLSSVPLYGLASLSLAWSDFEGLDGVSRVGAFDTRFIGNLMLGWRPTTAWELSGKFRFATGLPTTPFISSGPNAGQLDFSRYQEGPRLPAFHALDLRVDRRWSWRSIQLVTYLDIQNVYNRQNVSQYTWDERTQSVTTDEQLGILPTIGINLEF
jgi:hypothetical protein